MEALLIALAINTPGMVAIAIYWWKLHHDG